MKGLAKLDSGLDDDDEKNNYLSKTTKQKRDSDEGSNKSPIKITKVGSTLSKAALKTLVSVGGKHRESSSRYELYAEEHEDQLGSRELA